MRRRTLVWAAVTVVALLLTPPVMATYDLMQPENLRQIGGFKTGTEARYDLDVFDGPAAPFHVDDYYEIRITLPERLSWIDGTERDVVRIIETERFSRLPVEIEQPLGDETVERWLDAETGEIIGTRIQETRWYEQRDGWDRQVSDTTYRGAAGRSLAETLPTDLILYDAPLNTTLVLKALKKVEDLDNVHPAHGTATIAGVPVLGHLLSRNQLGGREAPCSMPTLTGQGWPRVEDHERISFIHAWYDNDEPLPLRIDCTSERDGGDVYAATTRTHLSVTGAPISMTRAPRTIDTPHPDATSFSTLPPESGEALPYPLTEAHEAVTSDRGLHKFQRFLDATDRYALQRARFSVDPPTNPPPSMMLPVPLPGEVEDQVARGFWVLTYVNADGDEMTVTTTRSLSAPGEPENRENDPSARYEDPAKVFAALDQVKILSVEDAVALGVADGVPFDETIGDRFSFELGYGVADGMGHIAPKYTLSSWGDDGSIQRSYDARSGEPTFIAAFTRDAVPPPTKQAEPVPRSTFWAETGTGFVAGTAAVAGASAIALFFLHSKTVLGLLYAKIARSKVLDHPRREELYEFVRINPGTSLRDAQQALDLGWGSAIHHLATLERHGFLASRRSGRHRRFWVLAEKPLDEIRREALLAEPTPRRILEMLTLEPNLSQAELARRLGLARSTVHHHVTRLDAAGLVPKASGKEGGDGGVPPVAAPLPPATVK